MKVVDSVEPEKVKQHLETELDYLDERHANARALYASGAAYGNYSSSLSAAALFLPFLPSFAFGRS